jgi:hypothetical protein
MSVRFQILILVSLSTAVWALLLLFRGVPVDPAWITSFGLAITIVTAVVVGVDRYFWRLGPLCRLVPSRPRIHGTWTGLVRSSKQDDPIEAFLVIRQNLLSVSILLLSERGRSHTIASNWGTTDIGDPAIFYTFRRFPTGSTVGRPVIRFGTGLLEICGKPPARIVGPYWTDVQTIGQLEFTKASWETYTEFKEAKEELGSQLSGNGVSG